MRSHEESPRLSWTLNHEFDKSFSIVRGRCCFVAVERIGAIVKLRGSVRFVRRHIHVHQGRCRQFPTEQVALLRPGDAINPKRPRDWTTPVDYRNGTVHIRTEVIEKPAGSEPTTWSLCYIPNRGRGNGYGCTGTVIYREKGVYEQDVSMKSFWQNDAIVWSDGIKQMDLVIKDNSGGQGPCAQA